MSDFLRRLFSDDFMPHGHCSFWKPEIAWLHVISDALIALAYCSIPVFVGAHDGTVAVESRPREGSAFRIVLPRPAPAGGGAGTAA